MAKPEEQNSAKKQEKSANADAEQKPEAAKAEEPKPKKKPLPAKPWLKKKKPVVKKVKNYGIQEDILGSYYCLSKKF